VTNAPNLLAAANATLLLRAGSEVLRSSKTYLASLAALSWLGDHVTGR
jgi:hypothetical protein